MKYFTIEELTRSDYALAHDIDNTPPPEAVIALSALVRNVLDPLRELNRGAIIVTSGYRSPDLNRAIGGAVNSQHMKGEAADITVFDRKDNRRLFEIIRDRLPFDQLIWEKGDATGPDWVHVSFRSNNNRKQIIKL